MKKIVQWFSRCLNFNSFRLAPSFSSKKKFEIGKVEISQSKIDHCTIFFFTKFKVSIIFRRLCEYFRSRSFLEEKILMNDRRDVRNCVTSNWFDSVGLGWKAAFSRPERAHTGGIRVTRIVPVRSARCTLDTWTWLPAIKAPLTRVLFWKICMNIGPCLLKVHFHSLQLRIRWKPESVHRSSRAFHPPCFV